MSYLTRDLSELTYLQSMWNHNSTVPSLTVASGHSNSDSHTKTTVKLLSVNVNRIKSTKKIVTFQQLNDSVKPYVIVGCESKLDSIYTGEAFPTNYNVFRKDRNFYGGGVFIAIHDNIQVQSRPDLDVECDAIWDPKHDTLSDG